MDELTVDHDAADTATFMKTLGAAPHECINSIVVSTKISGERVASLVLVPATHRLRSKGLKNALGGKTSFMPMDEALALTGMERDSVGPVEAPEGLPIVADLTGMTGDRFYVGGGVIGRKYVLTRAELEALVTTPVDGIYEPLPSHD